MTVSLRLQKICHVVLAITGKNCFECSKPFLEAKLFFNKGQSVQPYVQNSFFRSRFKLGIQPSGIQSITNSTLNWIQPKILIIERSFHIVGIHITYRELLHVNNNSLLEVKYCHTLTFIIVFFCYWKCLLANEELNKFCNVEGIFEFDKKNNNFTKEKMFILKELTY